MMKIEKPEVYGWKAAIRGMRNPMNSWERSDTEYTCRLFWYTKNNHNIEDASTSPRIGENDLSLMKKLSAAGDDHAKFLRMINVTCDITAPLYWWKEFDTYKVGTVANSCSTMHKIHSEPITAEMFSLEHTKLCDVGKAYFQELEEIRKQYIKTRDKKYWYALIQLLPASFNQKRTVQLNYAVLKNMYHSRTNHKLDEWRAFCEWLESLPYAELITG